MRWSYSLRRPFVTCSAASSAADPGSGARMRGSSVFAIVSNVSPTRHTRGSAGFRFVNTRRMRSPRFGRLGNASTCSRESSLRHDTLRPTAGCGR